MITTLPYVVILVAINFYIRHTQVGVMWLDRHRIYVYPCGHKHPDSMRIISLWFKAS